MPLWLMPDVHFAIPIRKSDVSHCFPDWRDIILMRPDWDDVGVLVHEMVHVALNDLCEPPRHTLQHAEIEVSACDSLGVYPTIWALRKVRVAKIDQELKIPKRVSWHVLQNEATLRGVVIQRDITLGGGERIVIDGHLFYSNRAALRYLRVYY